MAHRCLADFLEQLGHAGELARVDAQVDPVLEAAEVTRRMAKTAGPALLFAALTGHDMPVLTNLLGTDARICRALGVSSLSDLSDRISEMAQCPRKEGWLDGLKSGPHLTSLGDLAPRKVRNGASQQVVRLGRDVDLGELPALQSGPDETGRTITAAATFTTDRQAGGQPAGRYDLRVLGPDRLAVCWSDHNDPARLLVDYRRDGEKMPLAAALGGHPAVLLAASVQVGPNVEACALAGLLRERPIDVVPCRTVELLVPAEAEIVIEGYVDPAEPPVETGPMTGPSGHYCLGRRGAVMRVTALTHRANPIFPAMVPDDPPHEVCTINRALSCIFKPLVKMAIPELVDYDLPTFGAGRQWATVSIRKTYAGQARRVAHAAWGLQALMFAKWLVLLDEAVDVRDPQQVLAAVATNVHPARDVFVHQGPADPFDVAMRPDELGCGLAVDATAKLPGEHPGPWPGRASMSETIRRLVGDRWVEYGLGPETTNR